MTKLSLVEYRAAYTHNGLRFDSWREVIDHAHDRGWTLNKYADPEDPAATDIDRGFAADVARDDASLVYVTSEARR